MPNEKAQVLATEAANSQMFAWQANHLAMCFNFRGRKKNSIKARHRRINRKKGKMSRMFPALFIQIHCTSTTECITFAKFSIQMTSWMIHIASTGTPRAACFSTNPNCIGPQRKQPKQRWRPPVDSGIFRTQEQAGLLRDLSSSKPLG